MSGRTWLVLTVASALTGCTTFQPVAGVEPQVGTMVAFDVNDAGRVALGGTMGPEIAQVEGQLLEKDQESYLLSVATVRLLRGGEQPWSGEQVRIKSAYLGSAYERRFSFGRSVALGAIGLGGFTAILVTRSLLGSGNTDDGQHCDSSCGGNQRVGRP